MNMEDSPLTDTRDLLGAIPTLMGFCPEHSLVVLGIAPSGRLGPIARVDFPDDHAEAAALLGKLVPQLAGFGVSHLIAVAYTRHVEPETAASVRAVLEALWEHAEATDLTTLAVWHVGPTLYRALPATAAEPVTDRSRLVDDLYSGRVLAELVAEGRPVATGTREDLFACLTSDPEVHRVSIAVLAERYRRELAGGERHAESAFLVWMDEAERARTTPDAVHELTPNTTALLTEDPRSAVLLSELLETVFTGAQTPPDTAVVGGARRVLEALVRPAPAGLAAHPLAVLAWWQDETLMAGEAAQRAAEDQGASTLAPLVTKMLGAGFRPGWTGASLPVR